MIPCYSSRHYIYIGSDFARDPDLNAQRATDKPGVLDLLTSMAAGAEDPLDPNQPLPNTPRRHDLRAKAVSKH